MGKLLLWSFLLVVLVVSPFVGVAPITVSELFDTASLSHRIFFDLRLPRILLALLSGASLAVAGLLFQTLFRNALMTPFTLGVSSGAVLGAGIAIKLGLGTILGISAVTLFGFSGSLITIFLLITLARYLKKAEHESLLLLGIALSFFYSAALMVIFYLSSFTQTHTIMRFTMGSLSIIGYDNVVLLGIFFLLLFSAFYLKRYEVAILAVSEEQAQLKGINVKQLHYVLLGVASLSIGALVSLTGPIGFVGLIIPHIVKKVYAQPVEKIIVHVAVIGALFLLACDTLTRAIDVGSEIPIGVITALIGGPFFIYLIITRK